jgi:hypothetical protein
MTGILIEKTFATVREGWGSKLPSRARGRGSRVLQPGYMYRYVPSTSRWEVSALSSTPSVVTRLRFESVWLLRDILKPLPHISETKQPRRCRGTGEPAMRSVGQSYLQHMDFRLQPVAQRVVGEIRWCFQLLSPRKMVIYGKEKTGSFALSSVSFMP